MGLSRIRAFLRARWRGLPLLWTFTVISLVLTMGLGAVVAAQIRTGIERRSIQELSNATRTGVDLTVSLIASTGADHGGAPLTAAQRLEQVRLITAASKVLVQQGDTVGAAAALPNGMAIGGAETVTVGTMLPLDAGIRAALRGETAVRLLHRAEVNADSGVTRVIEQRLLSRYGDLLELTLGAHAASGGPVAAVVRTYAALRPSRQRAAADVRHTVMALGIGLLVFWLVLFRLVLGASQTLRRQSEDNAHLATHDTMTGLPNRALLRERGEWAITAARRSGSHVALLLIDLDHFKEINDTLGHRYGDALLKQVGPRLREQLRASDMVARLGGDEFVVLLPDLREPSAAFEVAEKLVALLQAPFEIDGAAVDVGCSVGVSTAPDDGDDFDQLLQHADIAMYVAKSDNLGVVAYAPALDSHSLSKLALLGELRRAIDAPDQIVLHYQPKANMATGRVVGVEALVRWQHPVHGLLAPAEFIPLAERTGLIRALTWCILRKALADNAGWAAEGLFLRVAVNVSARSLLDDAFTSAVVQCLQDAGVPADRLELELTESAVMTDPDRALAILTELDASGIRLAIDDFGTGYSSMAYLKRFPVREIKIDRTFVTGMDRDSSDAAIVRTSLQLAQNLNMDVVAEGVETSEVWDQLGELGCSSAQGYFLARPLPVKDFRSWLVEYSSSLNAELFT